jgi:hypothetical protein
VRTLHKRAKTHGIEKSDWKLFALVTAVLSVPVIVSILLIVWSTRPDLYELTPVSADAKVKSVDWRTLDQLAMAHVDPVASRPDLFGPEIQVAGYMISSEASNASSISHFLLVPDPGNWLHPPHTDPGEVIEVRLNDGRTPFLDRKPVVVRGALSIDRSAEKQPSIVYHLAASAVSTFTR